MPTDVKRQMITVNGEQMQLPEGETVADLLRRREFDPQNVTGVAVAVNEEVVRQQDWPEQLLQEGDEVEIITAKQGG